MSDPLFHGAHAGLLTSVDDASQAGMVHRDDTAPRLLLAGRRVPLLLAIFAFALAARMVALAIVQQWPVASGSDLWKSGLELVNIATSIVAHHGFSSPFGVPSGPTAWIAPVYPYFIAGVFSFFGPRSNLAALCILLAQAILSALICFPIYFIGKNAFGEKTAVWASWAWALFPYTVLIPVLFIWETALSALLLTLLCQLCMELPAARMGRLIGIGVLFGFAALTNTALLAVMPFFLVWPYLRRSSLRSGLRAILTIVFVFALVVLPWFLRNLRTLDAVVPLRTNFGEELWLGNHEGGNGRTQWGISPSDNKVERERYIRMGEVAYIAQRKAEAYAFIAQHPGSFVSGVLYRVRYWWFGEGEPAPVYYLYRLLTLAAVAGIVFVWRTGRRGAELPILALLVFPLVYYLTDVYARYRYPIEPFMILLGAFAATQSVAVIKTKLGS